ncbi:MAG: TolB-like protein/DNA-binding winged helix-turn-helix (wHTH) protein [Glaciecola sp.]|jgi:TolB-like protein/DNA-binding winged helix-turn-helix (wHTH) protein/tetratricopeptide (TPR) repeat protein
MADDFYMGKWQCFPDDCYVSDGKQKIKLEPKAMDVLLVLAKADGQLVARDDIFSAVWKNQIIADHVLYNLIANLRKVLEDNPQKPKYLLTVPKKGYRLGQQVQQLQEARTKTKNLKWQAIAIVCASFIIVISMMAYWVNKPSNEKSTPSAEIVMQPSIAVLPFDVYDSEPNLSYFADGLSEEIIHQLTAIPELAVVSRTSSFAFRDKDLDVKTIANKLNSQFVLEGSIRKSGDQLRVTIQLIKATTGTHLWSKVFDFTENEVFKLQQDISLSIVDSLLPDYAQIPVGKLRIHPQHGDAYMHYLRGNAMAAKATVEYSKKAIQEFETAIELQPDYALAHVSIALNTMVLFQYRVIPSAQARDIAQAAIDRALEIDPFLALAHTAQGLLHLNYRAFPEAEEAFITALNLDPALHLAHHNYGYLLWLQDKHEQALDHFQIALARNPMSAITNFAVADSLFIAGQLNDALKQFEHCVALLPDYPACHLGIANFYRFINQPQKVQKHMLAAKKQLADNNIYWITAESMDALWQGNVEKADSLQNKIATFGGGGYLELQLKTLINMQKGTPEQWLLELESTAKKWPKNKSVILVLALNYYFSGDCSASMPLYESVLLEDIELHGKFNVAAWGVSHLANMADCYQQANNQVGYQKMMQSLTLQMEKFQTVNYVIPGLILVEAKIDILTGKSAQSKSKLEHLATLAWPLEWIKNVDPIFLSSK